MGSQFDIVSGDIDYIRHKIKETFAETVRQMTRWESKKAEDTVSQWLDIVEQAGKQSGTFDLPADFGDRLIAESLRDPYTGAALDTKRADDVTDDDIRWWWSMHDLQRRMFSMMDDFSRMAALMAFRDRGLNPEQAIAELRKYYPIYGNPEDTSAVEGNDREIPHELRRRVHQLVEDQKHDPVNFKARVERATSMNAIIREEILKGNI